MQALDVFDRSALLVTARSAFFIDDLGLRCFVDGGESVGGFEVRPELCVPATDEVRVAVLATLADVLVGRLVLPAVAPAHATTVDLAVRKVGATPRGGVEARGRRLRSGRRVSVGEVVFASSTGGPPFAIAHATFISMDRRPPGGNLAPLDGAGTLSRPLADQVGARIVCPGVAAVDPCPYVLNPAGALQGGIVALLAEVAAETAARAGGRGDEVTRLLDVRYLARTGAGTLRAIASAVDGGGRSWRVELSEGGGRGGGDEPEAAAVVAVAVAETAPPDAL